MYSGVPATHMHTTGGEDLERQLEVLHVGLVRFLKMGHQRHMDLKCMNNRIHSTY